MNLMELLGGMEPSKPLEKFLKDPQVFPSQNNIIDLLIPKGIFKLLIMLIGGY